MTTLSAYKIVWLALIPVKGSATKEDAKKASKKVSNYNSYFSVSKKAIYTHQPNKEAALKKLKMLKGSLSKQYKAYIFTDKQFGMSSKDNPDIVLMDNGLGVKLTTLQKNESVLIK